MTAPLHIVDELIEERAPRLRASPVWPLVRPPLYAVLGYRKAREMADEVMRRSGPEAMQYVSGLLSLKVEVRGLERIPRSGRMVIVCNHPTGIADGIAMYDALKPVRPDAIFFANADALRVSQRLGEVVIPVEWVEAKRTREKTRDTLLRARDAFEQERCVVVFPAGRLATRGVDGLLNDPLWQPSALSLARKYGAPVVPIHMIGPSSILFHLFHRVSQELRDITLFHEMLNKEGKSFRLIVGHPIPPDALDADATAGTAALKTFVERRLPRDPDLVFA
jgi:putative hemolysin